MVWEKESWAPRAWIISGTTVSLSLGRPLEDHSVASLNVHGPTVLGRCQGPLSFLDRQLIIFVICIFLIFFFWLAG